MANSTAKAKKKQWQAYLKEEVKTESSLKQSGLQTLTDLVLGVVVGGAVGSAVGKPSFFLGLAGTFAGHYTGQKWLTPIGLGMMASTVVKASSEKTVQGFDVKTELQNAKERLNQFKNALMEKTYLDKVIKSKQAGSSSSKTIDEGVSGFGTVSDNERALEEVEKQLVKSAVAFQRSRGQSTSGLEDEIQGTEEVDFSGM